MAGLGEKELKQRELDERVKALNEELGHGGVLKVVHVEPPTKKERIRVYPGKPKVFS